MVYINVHVVFMHRYTTGTDTVHTPDSVLASWELRQVLTRYCTGVEIVVAMDIGHVML